MTSSIKDVNEFNQLWERLRADESLNRHELLVGLVYWYVDASFYRIEGLHDKKDSAAIAEKLEFERLEFCMGLVDEFYPAFVVRNCRENEACHRILAKTLKSSLGSVNRFLTGGISKADQDRWRPHVDRVLSWLSHRDFVARVIHGRGDLQKMVDTFLQNYHQVLEWETEVYNFSQNPPDDYIDAVLYSLDFSELGLMSQFYDKDGVLFKSVTRRIMLLLKNLNHRNTGGLVSSNSAAIIWKGTEHMNLWEALLLQLLNSGQLDDKFDFQNV